MTTASFFLSGTGPICLARPSHRDVVAAPLRTPYRRSAAAIAASPKHDVDAAFVVHEARSHQAQTSIPSLLRHRGSLNPYNSGAVRAV
jgi:hypothetical protein